MLGFNSRSIQDRDEKHGSSYPLGAYDFVRRPCYRPNSPGRRQRSSPRDNVRPGEVASSFYGGQSERGKKTTRGPSDTGNRDGCRRGSGPPGYELNTQLPYTRVVVNVDSECLPLSCHTKRDGTANRHSLEGADQCRSRSHVLPINRGNTISYAKPCTPGRTVSLEHNNRSIRVHTRRSGCFSCDCFRRAKSGIHQQSIGYSYLCRGDSFGRRGRNEPRPRMPEHRSGQVLPPVDRRNLDSREIEPFHGHLACAPASGNQRNKTDRRARIL